MLIFTAHLVHLLRCNVKRTTISLCNVGEVFVEIREKKAQHLCFVIEWNLRGTQKYLSKILRKIHN